MATLNVKNLPDGLYRKLQARARRPLSGEDFLLQAVAQILRQRCRFDFHGRKYKRMQKVPASMQPKENCMQGWTGRWGAASVFVRPRESGVRHGGARQE